MRPSERQKICANCDGRIPWDAEICLYCRAELGPTPTLRSLEESLTAPYTPPYSRGSTAMDDKFTAKKKSEGFKEVSPEKRFATSLGAPSIAVQEEEQGQSEGEKSSFWSLLLLSIAANLAVIGLLQLFFSENGFLRLEWDSSYWFVYCLAALPLFFIGLRKARAL